MTGMREVRGGADDDTADVVLVASRPDSGPSAAVRAIAAERPDLHVYSNEDVVEQFNQNGFAYFRQISVVLSSITIVFTVLLVATILTVSTNQRLGEIAALRALGIGRRRIATMLLWESTADRRRRRSAGAAAGRTGGGGARRDSEADARHPRRAAFLRLRGSRGRAARAVVVGHGARRRPLPDVADGAAADRVDVAARGGWMTPPAIVEARRVGRVFPMPAGPVTALRDVSLRIDAADYVAITGPSGCGKSTLLHLVGCVDAPTSGSIVFEERDVQSLGEAERSRIRLTRIGFVFQRFFLLPMLTARENIELPQAEAGVSAAARARPRGELLGYVGLANRADHLPSQLSGGEMQRDRDRARVGQPAGAARRRRADRRARRGDRRSRRGAVRSRPRRRHGDSDGDAQRGAGGAGDAALRHEERDAGVVILRLALRSLAVRPLRTAVLAAGFGLGIAVMVALLGVGEVIIEQAHSPALRGGGDVVVSAAFGPVENARYVLAHVLGSPAVRTQQTAASPSSARPALPGQAGALDRGQRARRHSESGTSRRRRGSGRRRGVDRHAGGRRLVNSAAGGHPARNGSLPRAAPAASDPNEPKLPRLPRVRPGSDPSRSQTRTVFAQSWAEWLYFNGRSADGRLRFYLTFLAGRTHRRRRWGQTPGLRVPRARRDPGVRPPGRSGRRSYGCNSRRDGRSTNYSAGAPGGRRRPDRSRAGPRHRGQSRPARRLAISNHAGPREGRRRALAARRRAGPRRAARTLTLPPTAIHGARGWVSGYVVPVLSGAVHGSLRAGGETIDLDGAIGYHDHNWGFWEGVRWQWGQVAHGDLSIVFGRVFPPASVADPQRTPGVLAVLGPNGPLGFATDVSIEETPAPHRVTIRARGQRLDITLALAVEETVGTRMGLTRLANGQTMTFLQLGGTYRVTGKTGDRALDFTARGSAETFRDLTLPNRAQASAACSPPGSASAGGCSTASPRPAHRR